MMTFRHITRFRPASHISGGSLFDQISQATASVAIIGIFLGLYVYSSAALAEVEDGVNQDDGKSVYGITSLSGGLSVNFSVDRATNIDSHLEFYSPKDLSKFDEAIIPEAVWSLDASIENQLDRVYNGLGSRMRIIFAGDRESIGFWKNAAAGFSEEKSPYALLSPPQFQVASCGGSSAERSDLAYCGERHNNSSRSVDDTNSLQGDDPSLPTTLNTDDGIISSDSDSSPSPATQSNLAPLTSAPIANTLSRQGVLSLLTSPIPIVPLGQEDLTLQDQCNTAACLTVQIDTDPPAMQFISTTTAPALVTVSVPPSDPPTPPVGDLAPPIDSSPPQVAPPPIPVDAPGPGSDWPLGVTPPSQRPIPEASTWIMTVIGFGFVVFTFGTKRRNRVNPISIIDISEEY